MLIDGICRDCRHQFDAHWHVMPDPKGCPKCRSTNVVIRIDEDDDYKREAWEAAHKEETTDEIL